MKRLFLSLVIAAFAVIAMSASVAQADTSAENYTTATGYSYDAEFPATPFQSVRGTIQQTNSTQTKGSDQSSGNFFVAGDELGGDFVTMGMGWAQNPSYYNCTATTPEFIVWGIGGDGVSGLASGASDTFTCTDHPEVTNTGKVDAKIMRRSSLIHDQFYFYINGTHTDTVTFGNAGSHFDALNEFFVGSDSGTALAMRVGHCTNPNPWSVSQQAANQTPATWTNIATGTTGVQTETGGGGTITEALSGGAFTEKQGISSPTYAAC